VLDTLAEHIIPVIWIGDDALALYCIRDLTIALSHQAWLVVDFTVTYVCIAQKHLRREPGAFSHSARTSPHCSN